MTASSLHKGRAFKPLLLAFALSTGLHTGTALAQTASAAQTIDIPAGNLSQALDRLGELTGVLITYEPGLVQGFNAPRVSGQLTPGEALRRLLSGSDIQVEAVNDRTFVLRRLPATNQVPPARAPQQSAPRRETPDEPETQDLGRMTVTGSRIRGGSTPSPVITIGSERIQEEGFTDLGGVIRSIPQNFAGGQNPGIATGATGGGIANQNITGGSGLNLRGLGQDASLTLLNGRRMSYSGYVQMVDISAIPVEAVERMEIVPDGASAIYGSDAVGGVANVILKRDFDGLTVGTRYGTAADGGLTTRDYTATAGTAWSTGGLIATWKKTSNDPIYSNQRHYAQDMYQPATLYQGGDLRSGLLSGHQSLGNLAEVRLDVLRTEREILTDAAYPTSYYRYEPETTSTLVSPSVEFNLLNDWTLNVGAVVGKDESFYYQRLVASATGVTSANYSGLYRNKGRTYEVGAEGPLFASPGGDARLAIGAGYRQNDFLFQNISSNRTDADGDERSRFVYAELNLPLIDRNHVIRGLHRLALTGAIRAEDYDSFGGVATPKFGVTYSPVSDLTLKASWGESFKAPTLLQRYQSRNAYLYPTTTFGGAGYGPDATVLYLSGGNPDLEPERARTWSASLAFHPEALPGLEMELTWFDIDYTDRVLQPLVTSQALSNPIFAEFIRYSPTAAEQAEVLAGSRLFYNYAGAAYDASNVVAIIPNRYVNTSRQWAKGLDLTGAYRFDMDASQLTVRGSISWLDSTQATTTAQTPYDLAGTLFYPAKVSGRLGVVWHQGGFSTSLFGNYKSGVTDTTRDERGSSFTTFDTTLRYDTGERKDALSGLMVELSAQNVLNRAPPVYIATSPTNAPYDSTNYSAIGRYLSLSVSKHW
ncbi:TonB-dependent receptor [Luteimonas saliphila]|uniref:TonB-dependent receptor n=1 Tax=Luteimonas saliphila TaxID=2804919 RepID=UPI00192DD7D6|nr:TonB-dependent receptor [Luteimonas saliphila]